jgi:hypothetical protein
VNDRFSQLPWAELWHTHGGIPWSALETFADAVAAEPDLAEELFKTYEQAREVSLTKICYADLYVPAIFALAALKLDEDRRRRIGEFLVKKLAEAGKDDDDLMMEVLVSASGSMGPAIVPTVLNAIAAEPDTRGAWIHLWSLTALAAETEDAALRDQTVQACVGLLERADRGEVDVDDGMEAAHTLGLLRHTEYLELLKRLSKKCDPFAGRADYEAAVELLNGSTEQDEWTEAWEEPVQEWLAYHWQTVSDWFARQAAEELEDMNAPVTEPHSKVRRFLRSAWATDLPRDLSGEAPFIIGRLLDYAGKYKGAAPNELNEQVLRSVLLDVFPRRIAGPQGFFAKVAPVVEVFLEWMGSEGILENASTLARTVYDWAEEIVAAAMDPEKWGPTKAAVMEAEQTSVYVRDVEALQDSWHEQALQSLEHDAPDQEDESPFTPTAPIVEHTPKIGRNEPCPCGSGRKYKKCCGNPAKGQATNV